MKNALFLCFSILFLSGCNDRNDDMNCIEHRKQLILFNKVADPPAKITKFNYEDRIVYLLPTEFYNCGGCADHIAYEVVDEFCNYVCSPSGGFSGEGDFKCTDFFEVAIMIEVFWTDPR